MTSVSLTGTNHTEDQEAHLRVIKSKEYENEWYGDAEPAGAETILSRKREHVKTNVGEFAGLLGRACPAGVYEYVDDVGVQLTMTV